MVATSRYSVAPAPAKATSANGNDFAIDVDEEATSLSLADFSEDESEAEHFSEADLEEETAAVLKNRRTTDLVRLYLQEIGRVRLLERHEEVAEAQRVQAYMGLLQSLEEAAQTSEHSILAVYSNLLQTRDRLTSRLGYRPSLERWAAAANVPAADLKPTLAAGKQS
jgi:RNA polymerase nonessential primary-like sigma factor